MIKTSEPPNRAVVTLSAMMGGFVGSRAAKLATVWFDEVLFDDVWHSPNVHVFGGTSDFPDWITRTLLDQEGTADIETIKFLRKRWKGIFGNDLAEYSFVTVPKGSLSRRAERVVSKMVEREVVRPMRAEGVHPSEIGRNEIGASKSLRTLLLRSGNLPAHTTLLGSSQECRLLVELGIASRAKQERTAAVVLSERVADLSVLRWDEIAGLCRHRYYRSFREKVKALSALWQGKDMSEIARLAHEAFHDATEELARQARPGPRLWRLIKIVLGNTTPLGWLFGAGDESRDTRMERHGWAYFLMDLSDRLEGRTTLDPVFDDATDGVTKLTALASGLPLELERSDEEAVIERRCSALTKAGSRCTREAGHASGLCRQHPRLKLI